MNIYVIVLRILHIFAGMFWVGAAWMITFFIEPVSSALGPDAQKFMQRLMGQGRLSIYISVAALVNVLTGALLYWKDSAGLSMAWMGTPVGTGFTVGAILGIVALIVGSAVTGPASARLAKLGSEIQAGGKPPTPDQLGAIQKVQARLKVSGRWSALLTGLALLAMSIARYL